MNDGSTPVNRHQSVIAWAVISVPLSAVGRQTAGGEGIAAQRGQCIVVTLGRRPWVRGVPVSCGAAPPNASPCTPETASGRVGWVTEVVDIDP